MTDDATLRAKVRAVLETGRCEDCAAEALHVCVRPLAIMVDEILRHSGGVAVAAAAGLLTPTERRALEVSAQLAGLLGEVVADGPTRMDDLRELINHVHVIQHAVMSQAAARAHPNLYRLLGETL